MIHWIFFSTIATGLFYGLYAILLRRDRWFQLSRLYLLVTLVFSLVFPLIRLPQALSTSLIYGMQAEPILLREVTTTSETATYYPTDILPIVYYLGFAVTLVALVFQVIGQAAIVLMLRRKHPVYGEKDGYTIPHGASLILLPDDTAPYSFFNQIVVGTRSLSNDELLCILAHESLHVRRTHTLDLIVMRTLCCVAWFNPFAWLMTYEMRAVHEFQADATSLGICNRKEYLHLLYRQAPGIGYGHITNNFQSIKIKNRIAMMNKPKTRYGAWKLLTVLPVAALMMVVGCQPAAKKANDTEEPTTVSQTVPADTTPGHVTIAASDDASVLRAEDSPEFVGGMEALSQYIADNIRYPEQAKRDNTQGRVFVRFVVEPDGSVADAEVLRGIGSGCDEEALRVVNAMPKWKPGRVNGNPVRVQYTLPITFKLQ